MGFSIEGTGFEECGYFAPISWQKHKASFLGVKGDGDHDAVLCIAFFGLPIIPLKPVHVFSLKETEEYSKIPLRWNVRLIFHVFYRIYGIIPLSFTAFMLAEAILVNRNWLYAIVSLGLFCFTLDILLATKRIYGRSRNIRLLLGRHKFGSSDPALWARSVLVEFMPELQMPSEISFEKKCRKYMNDKNWLEAIWAARLCCAIESRKIGEALTNEMLANKNVAVLLKDLKLNTGKYYYCD